MARDYQKKRLPDKGGAKRRNSRPRGTRGVFNNMRHLTEAERNLGVISISAGNHAQALAYVATRMGVRSTIVMPARAVRSKVEATREYGGEVILTEGSLLETMQRVQEERHLTLVHLARATKRWRPGNSV